MPKFEKGHKKVGGKKKGSKNTKTKQWEELGLMHEEGGAGIAKKILKAYGDKAFKDDGSINPEFADKYMDHYKNLLEYFKPKQARVENIQENEIVIKVKHE